MKVISKKFARIYDIVVYNTIYTVTSQERKKTLLFFMEVECLFIKHILRYTEFYWSGKWPFVWWQSIWNSKILNDGWETEPWMSKNLPFQENKETARDLQGFNIG